MEGACGRQRRTPRGWTPVRGHRCFAKDTGGPALGGGQAGAAAAGAQEPLGAAAAVGAASPSVVFKSIPNLPESLKWVFFTP